jgi:D-psicose/D-tagatose/L-ribulose 3-epimerase
MKIAISNIAWREDEDAGVGRLMQEFGIDGLEIAPTRVWKDPTAVSAQEIQKFRDFWRSFGISISSFQSLLFGQNHFQIFSEETLRNEMEAYLVKIIDLASKLEARKLVFGSPKNRLRGQLSMQDAILIAAPFFRKIGDYAKGLGVQFCIEPNPKTYGCDFITNAEEGREFVKLVNSPGFGLHLDGAGTFLALKEELSTSTVQNEIKKSSDLICHFHVSQPHLATLNTCSDVDYVPIFETLKSTGYSRWLSIEMRAGPRELSNLSNVRDSIAQVKRDVDGL